MICLPCFGHAPRLKSGVRAAPNATVVGNVTADANVSFWYGSVVRSEKQPIVLEEHVAVEDNVVIHTSPNDSVSVGRCTILGHSSTLHGCTLGEYCLVGIGATLLNGCVLGDHCLVSAGSVVPPGTVIPAGSLVMGSPAKVKRPLTQKELDQLENNHLIYAEYAAQLEYIP